MPSVIAHPQLPKVQNMVLQHLAVHDCTALLAQAELVELDFSEQLCDIDDVYQHVYFPLSAFVSLIEKLPGHPPLEMGLIGFDGMLGVTLLLQTRIVPSEAVVQGAGLAWRLDVATFEMALGKYPSLAPALQQYLFVLLRQLMSNATCTHFHPIEARLARWLLMSHDRVQSDELYLTHQFLADMLGVRRSGVTVAAGVLQDCGIIEYRRGWLTILDRPALLARSCRCYQKVAL